MSQLLQLACISDQDEVCIRASEVYMLPIDMPLTKEYVCMHAMFMYNAFIRSD